MVGYIVCMATQNGIARYIVSYIYVVGLFGANPLIQTWISGTLSKSPEQKATSIAINNILGQAGNVMAPYFFIASDEPKYQSGACGGSTRSCCVMLWSMIRRTTLIFSGWKRYGSVSIVDTVFCCIRPLKTSNEGCYYMHVSLMC
jgi:hypothetical protein